jgi:hypothetical protein
MTSPALPDTGKPSTFPVFAAPPARPAGSCDVCGHPMAEHDVIAGRFCDATQENALSRGCICAQSKA